MKSPFKLLRIYTDGACSGNPGPGGVGVVLTYGNTTKIISEMIEGETTNQRAELSAVIVALKALKKPSRIHLYTDSEAVKGWLTGSWKVKNPNIRTLVDEIDNLIHDGKHQFVDIVWIRGHNGHPYNETANILAQEARDKAKEKYHGN